MQILFPTHRSSDSCTLPDSFTLIAREGDWVSWLTHDWWWLRYETTWLYCIITINPQRMCEKVTVICLSACQSIRVLHLVCNQHLKRATCQYNNGYHSYHPLRSWDMGVQLLIHPIIGLLLYHHGWKPWLCFLSMWLFQLYDKAEGFALRAWSSYVTCNQFTCESLMLS